MSSQGGTYPAYSRFMNDGCALDANNLRTNSPSYYNGVGTTFCLPSSGKWFIENYVGNTYAAYPVQGFHNHQYASILCGYLLKLFVYNLFFYRAC